MWAPVVPPQTFRSNPTKASSTSLRLAVLMVPTKATSLCREVLSSEVRAMGRWRGVWQAYGSTSTLTEPALRWASAETGSVVKV